VALAKRLEHKTDPLGERLDDGRCFCCVAPLVLVTLGIGGAWITTLLKLEPLRPVFVVLTFGLLGLAWHKLYRKSVVCEGSKPCAARYNAASD
jgi:MerT mercuric transport protein